MSFDECYFFFQVFLTGQEEIETAFEMLKVSRLSMERCTDIFMCRRELLVLDQE